MLFSLLPFSLITKITDDLESCWKAKRGHIAWSTWLLLAPYLFSPCDLINPKSSSLAPRCLWSWSGSLSSGYHFLPWVTEFVSLVFTYGWLIHLPHFPSLMVIVLYVRLTALQSPRLHDCLYTHSLHEIAILIKERNQSTSWLLESGLASWLALDHRVWQNWKNVIS